MLNFIIIISETPLCENVGSSQMVLASQSKEDVLESNGTYYLFIVNVLGLITTVHLITYLKKYANTIDYYKFCH